MHKKIIFITGGARSGKSSFALKESFNTQGRKAYIATAEALDEEMRERIEKHKNQRGKEWDTYEEPLKIAGVVKEIEGNYSAIVIDCLTLWLSNIMIRTQSTEQRAQNTQDGIQAIEVEIDKLLDSLRQFKDSSIGSLDSGCCILHIISNEVGMGIVPVNETARKFRDIAGMLNQNVAEVSDEVYLMVAGIPMKVKGKGQL